MAHTTERTAGQTAGRTAGGMVIVGGALDGLWGEPVVSVAGTCRVRGLADSGMAVDAQGPHGMAMLLVPGVGLVQVPAARLSPVRPAPCDGREDDARPAPPLASHPPHPPQSP